jgi:L-aspartate oxidase
MAITADLIIKSALIRKESRGAHYVIDYSDKNDSLYKKDTII